MSREVYLSFGMMPGTPPSVVKGENLATTLLVDCVEIIARWPGAVFSVFVRRPVAGEEAYPAAVGLTTDARGKIAYVLTDVDTAAVGELQFEFWAMQGDAPENVLAKSRKLTMDVRPSLGETSGPVPLPEEPGWVETVVDVAVRAYESEEASKEYSEKSKAYSEDSEDAATRSAKSAGDSQKSAQGSKASADASKESADESKEASDSSKTYRDEADSFAKGAGQSKTDAKASADASAVARDGAVAASNESKGLNCTPEGRQKQKLTETSYPKRETRGKRKNPESRQKIEIPI